MQTKKLLKKIFGYDDFLDGQRELIDANVQGQDVVGIMPTGSGKSLCFQIPALLHSGITLVISPLISLMKDQVRALSEYGVSVAFINSSLSYEQTGEVISNAVKGKYKIIYIAPERLDSAYFMRFAKNAEISMVAVDEAHCVSQWGHNFRPSYLKIKSFIDSLSKRPVLAAFTATATKVVLNDIVKLLGQKKPIIVNTGFDRPNLFFEVRKPKDKFSELISIVENEKKNSGIVYCSTRKAVEEVCFRLKKQGFSATRYHAGLSDNERKKNQEKFLYDKKSIMVATNAFGMGIDKSNVSFVVHYNIPKNIESYYQEAGRAGRDGSDAKCILLYSKRDVSTIKYFIDKSDEESELDEERKQIVLEHEYARLKKMTFYCSTTECLRDYILDYFGDSKKGYCGYCGSCLKNYEEVDITVEAQMILSCVFKTRERFGVSTIIDVLRGSKAQKIIGLGLDSSSTYGLMKAQPQERVRSIIDFLVLKGYLIMTDSKYPVLILGKKAVGVIKGKERIVMQMPKEEEKAASKKGRRNKEEDYDEELYQLLREDRMEIAKENEVPAFVVFSNATLADMSRKKPTSIYDFLSVKGVGELKAKKYAQRFISVIMKHK